MAVIIDMNYDILAFIILYAVQSSDGPENLAKIITICKGFNVFGNDKSILRSISFDEEKVTTNFKLFQNINGLLFKCAHAGNLSALFLLSKVMLLSTSELLAIEGGPAQPIFVSDGQTDVGSSKMRCKPKGDSSAISFLHWFMPKQARAISSSSQSIVHYDLANYFVSRCTIYHLLEMRVHLDNYIDYFCGTYDNNREVLHQVITQMCSIAARGRDLKHLYEIKQDVDKFKRIVREEIMKENVRFRSNEFVEAAMRFTIVVLALKNKCREVELNYDEYFGAGVDPETFQKYVLGTFERFEFYRAAFGF